MKYLSRLIRQSALILMAALLLVFSGLTYIGGDALLRRFVDGRLLGLAETLAKIVEQYPAIIESTGEGGALTATIGGNNKEPYQLQDVIHSLRVFLPDGRLMWKAPNAATQQSVPDRLLEQVRAGHRYLKPVRRSMARLFGMCSFRSRGKGRCGTCCRQKHP